jgi:hypothetical protein
MNVDYLLMLLLVQRMYPIQCCIPKKLIDMILRTTNSNLLETLLKELKIQKTQKMLEVYDTLLGAVRSRINYLVGRDKMLSHYFCDNYDTD